MAVRVGFFDLATTSGAAFCSAEGERPVLSTYRGRVTVAGEYGALFTGFRCWANELIDEHRPTHLGFEAPWISTGNRKPSRFTNPDVVYLLVSLAGHAEEIAHDRGLVCFKGEVSTIRKAITGNGRAKKPEVMRCCRMFGWPVANDHEADAAAGWAWARSQLDPRFAATTTPLFSRASA